MALLRVYCEYINKHEDLLLHSLIMSALRFLLHLLDLHSSSFLRGLDLRGNKVVLKCLSHQWKLYHFSSPFSGLCWLHLAGTPKLEPWLRFLVLFNASSFISNHYGPSINSITAGDKGMQQHTAATDPFIRSHLFQPISPGDGLGPSINSFQNGLIPLSSLHMTNTTWQLLGSKFQSIQTDWNGNRSEDRNAQFISNQFKMTNQEMKHYQILTKEQCIKRRKKMIEAKSSSERHM